MMISKARIRSLNHLASSPACEGSLKDATVGETNPDQAVAVFPLSARRLSFPHRLRRLLVSSEYFWMRFTFILTSGP
jgi:hypothetical protein